MSSGPYRSELIDDKDFQALVEGLCKRPGMYVRSGNVSAFGRFEAVIAYLDGYNEGAGRAPLMGFQEWQVVRSNGGNNVHWPAVEWPPDNSASEAEHLSAVAKLGDLLREFFEIRCSIGLAGIFHEYSKWLLRKSWYDGPLRKSASRRAAQITLPEDRPTAGR